MSNRKSLIAFFVLVFALSLSLSGLLADDRISLGLRFQESKSYNIMSVTEQEITQGFEGQQQTINQIVGMGYAFDIIKTEPNGDSTIKVKFHQVYIDHNGPDGKFKYD